MFKNMSLTVWKHTRNVNVAKPWLTQYTFTATWRLSLRNHRGAPLLHLLLHFMHTCTHTESNLWPKLKEQSAKVHFIFVSYEYPARLCQG